MRVVTILARHGAVRYGDAIPSLDELFARRLPGVTRDLVVVDTDLPETQETKLAPGRVVLGASNRHWEWSAWDRGIAHLGARLHGYDWIHLATSAYRALDSSHLSRLGAGALAALGDRRAALGHIDHYNDEVVIAGHASQSWLRSSFIFVRPQELAALGSLVSVREPGRWFSGDPGAPFRADAPLSENCRRYIVGWLTGRGTGQGVTWHSRFDLSAETLPLFEAKTMAILNEHLLGVRLRAAGCELVDLTWLAARRAVDAIPDWKRQVADRGR